MIIGIIGYAICLAAVIFLLFPFLPDLFKGMLLSQDNWQPSFYLNSYPMSLTVFFVIGPALAFIIRFFKSIKSPGLRKSASWLIIRAVFVGLTIFLYFGTFETIRDARKLFNVRIEKRVFQLQKGMSRKSVETLIQQTDAFTKSSPSTDKNVSFERKYNFGFGSEQSIVYHLDIEYDHANKLRSAFYYKKEDDFDANYHDCSVIFKVPPSNKKQYPYPCPKQK